MYPNELDSWQAALVRSFDEQVLRPPAADEPHNEKRLFLKLVGYSFPDKPKNRSTDALAAEFELEPRSIRRMIVELNAKLDAFFAPGGLGGRSLYRLRIVHLPVGRPSKEQAEARNRVVFELNANQGFEARKFWAPHLASALDATATGVCLVRSEPLRFLDTETGAEIRHGAVATLEDLGRLSGSDELAAAIGRMAASGRLRPKPGAPPAEETAVVSAVRAFLASEGVPADVESPGRLPAYGPLYDSRHLILFGCAATNPAIAKLTRPDDWLRIEDHPPRERGRGLLYRTWLLITRFPNPMASGRAVTVVESRHPRAFEAFERVIGSADRLRQFLGALQVAADDVLPDEFQALVSVELNDQDELAGDGNLTVVERTGFPGVRRRPPDRVVPLRPPQNKKGAGG